MIYRTREKTWNSAQTVAEYAIFLSIVVLVFTGMNMYIKRGMAARLKDAADLPLFAHQRLGYATNSFTTNQYEPLYTSRTALAGYDSRGSQAMFRGGSMKTDSVSSGSTNTTETISDTY